MVIPRTHVRITRIPRRLRFRWQRHQLGHAKGLEFYRHVSKCPRLSRDRCRLMDSHVRSTIGSLLPQRQCIQQPHPNHHKSNAPRPCLQWRRGVHWTDHNSPSSYIVVLHLRGDKSRGNRHSEHGHIFIWDIPVGRHECTRRHTLGCQQRAHNDTPLCVFGLQRYGRRGLGYGRTHCGDGSLLSNTFRCQRQPVGYIQHPHDGLAVPQHPHESQCRNLEYHLHD